MATRTITITWPVDGVLTDVTTAKLSDPTGTYGVKRDDTDAAVVADGTAMTRTDTGTYEYSFTAIGNTTYTAYVEIVYLGATYHLEVDIAALTEVDILLTYSQLKVEIADYLGWSRDSDNWTADEVGRLNATLDAGYRQFIYPPIAPGENVGYRWSFLRPSATFDTVASTYLYDMPSDFAAIVGDLLYDED